MAVKENPTYVPTVGERLLNGATIVAYREQRNYWIVLAVREGYPDDPYATWAVSAGDGEAFWGHYHNDLVAAIADYHQR
jgi:hypothetical protein